MYTILYIEDNNSLREEIIDFLSLEGYHTLGAENGKAGIEIATNNHIDLILSDIMMPDMNGYEVRKHIRSNPIKFKIPFIFISALSDNFDIRKGMDLGADDYLIKPVSLINLRKSILARLEKAEQYDSYVETRLNELQENMIFSLTHELFTPLHVILGLSDLIEENTNSFSLTEMKEMAAAIKNSGNRLLNLANDLLSDRTKNTILKSDDDAFCDAFDVITPITEMVAQRHRRENDLYLEVENARLLIEPGDLEFVIKEITDNAFKFSDTNSAITIWGKAFPEFYKIIVTDQGTGFPFEENNLFDIGAFIQFNRKKLEQQGTGLGLITSILILQRNKGNLEIRNNKIGASVSFTIPIINGAGCAAPNA